MTLNTSIIKQTHRNANFGIQKKIYCHIEHVEFIYNMGYMPFLSKKINYSKD